MAGGLSPRRFFRALTATGASAVVMWLPPDAPERELARRTARRLPFLEMRETLENAHVRVPRLLGALPDEGLLVVEDVGQTLADVLVETPDTAAQHYRRAVQELAKAQQALSALPPSSIARGRSFDRTLLTWEFDHFLEWGVEALGVTLSGSERLAFEGAREHVVREMTMLTQGFVHRDYQSRNLCPQPDGNIAWLDFQDALWGPRAYDLVALLRDSYQSFEEEFVSARLEEFAAARGLTVEDLPALRLEFDIITVQRKLKDAGRFVYFERTRGDASYLRYFVPTLEMVRAALRRLAQVPQLLPLEPLVERQIEIGRRQGMLLT